MCFESKSVEKYTYITAHRLLSSRQNLPSVELEIHLDLTVLRIRALPSGPVQQRRGPWQLRWVPARLVPCTPRHQGPPVRAAPASGPPLEARRRQEGARGQRAR